MPRLWVLSDLHMEIDPDGRRGRLDPPEFDVLVNAGDTYECRPVECVERTARLAGGRPAILVLGNHDFYGIPVGRGTQVAREHGIRLGVHVLQGSSVEIEGLRFAGGTLWDRPMTTMANGRRPNLMSIMSGDTPAFFAPHEFAPYVEPIQFEDQGRVRAITNIEIETMHVRTMDAIASAEADVVVTHYPPSDEQVGRVPTATHWIHGHIHGFERRLVGATEVVLNAAQSRVFADRMVIDVAPRREVVPSVP